MLHFPGPDPTQQLQPSENTTMHAVIRRYRVRLGTVASAARLAEDNLLPRMNRLPGFVAYYLLDAGDGVLASISVCETSEGAEAAATLAAEWFRSDWPSFQLIPPAVTDGEILVHAEVGRGAGRRRSERRRVEDRRAGADRRGNADRRQTVLPAVVERRDGAPRRLAAERRERAERRSVGVVVREAGDGARASRRTGLAPAWRRSSRIG